MRALAYLFSAIAAIPLGVGCALTFVGGLFAAVGLSIETWAWDTFQPYDEEDL